MKAFRALQKAQSTVRGDFEVQYGDLRDYIDEVMRCNPETTVRVEVEPGNPKAKHRVFKRIYICLGPLKRGFKAIGRDLIGVDGAFMKEPATGQLLTAVGIDSNNGIYPVAYAIVEQENCNSWTWFLECLGDDLELHTMSNFTFISDRQKGLIQAVAKTFPCAEHRFCLRHIHENMKLKWRGLAYKQHLWNCATATTLPQFEKAMLLFKDFNEECYKWLLKIPPQHWARSHFSGRAISGVLLNNMCEVLNRWLVDARDKPIISALEYVREYLMKRIVNVLSVSSNCDGPLTPSATKLFESIKRDAGKCTVLWSGSDKYQVNGPHNDQCVVDFAAKNCACRRWEISGMPCKHDVAALWNMAVNGKDVGIPEVWVHPVYWLGTWQKTYTFTINPVNGRSLWSKSKVPTTLLPPKQVATAGRPKKNRRKAFDENESIDFSGKLSRKGKSLHCSHCGGYGHNIRSCNSEGKGEKRKKEASGSGTKKKSRTGAT